MNSPESSISFVNCSSQLRIKREESKILLFLPDSENINWIELCQELQCRLQGTQGSWEGGTLVYLMAKDILIDARQLQMLASSLMSAQLELKWICTSRRQTAVAAATAGYCVEQQLATQSLTDAEVTPNPTLAEPLYLETTVRSGMEIRHPGHVVILGDLNPGSSVVAQGDIIIWGILRGIAHAGAQGNRESRIMALKMDPTQLRIADMVARAPDAPFAILEPEVAYITTQGICIAKAVKFSKTHTFVSKVGAWIDSEKNTLDNSEEK